MAACATCGETNPDRARFCLGCGSPITTEINDGREVRKIVTVLFTDVTGSTSLGERLDPESFRRLMERFFDQMKEIVEHYDGTVVDFIGDAVMAVFGIPRLHEDDPLRALRAASDMLEILPSLNDDLHRLWGTRLQLRTGINTGVVSGDSAAAGRTVILGDTVNVASRIEQAAQPGEILMGENTYRLVRDVVQVEPLEPIGFKGKSNPVGVYRLAGAPQQDAISSQRFDSPMVGRERESMLLHQAFERAKADRTCHLFTVLGPAGVGKSRLVSEVTASFGREARVFQGRCLPYGKGITFWPLAEVVEEAAGLSPDDPSEIAKRKIVKLVEDEQDCEQISQGVGQLIGLGERAVESEQTFWAVRRLFEAMSGDRSLVVVFDDIHWAEPTFLNLVDYVVDWARDQPILIVCLARAELLEVRPQWGGGKFNATTILMEPLGEDQCQRLIDNLLGSEGLDDRVRTHIVQSGEGNPLFVEETVSMLIDDGLLERRGDVWVETGDLTQVSVPPSIHALLAARLDRLSSEERRVIEAASIVGREFPLAAVVDLARSETQKVKESLANMVRKQLIKPHVPSAGAEDVYRFRHLLIRDVAYEGISKQVRAELHEQFARWSEEAAGDRVAEYEEILAYHFEQGFKYREELSSVSDADRELATKAAGHLSVAGRRAFTRNDIHAAINLMSRSAELLAPDDEERLRLSPDFSAALSEVGEFARAEAVLSEAIENARKKGYSALEAHARVERSLLQIQTDTRTSDEAYEVARHAVSVFEGARDDRGLARAHRLLGEVYWGRSHYAETERALETALDRAHVAGDSLEEMKILAWLPSAALWGPTPVDQALIKCEGILSAGSDNVRVRCKTLAAMAAMKAMKGNFDEARELSAQADRIASDLKLTALVANVTQLAGYVETLAGDALAAEKELRRGYETLVAWGDVGHVSSMAALLAAALYHQGRFDEAGEFIRISEDSAAPDDADAQTEWRRNKAKIVLREGRLEEAQELVTEAMEIVDATDLIVLQGDVRIDAAEILGQAGRGLEAAALVRRAVELFEAKGNAASAEAARGVLAGS